MSISVVHSTVDHDRSELWLDKHYLEIINYLRPIIDKRYPTFKNSNIIRSKLLLERTFSGKTIDALIQLEFEYSGKQKASYDMTIVLDIKPKLERISDKSICRHYR